MCQHVYMYVLNTEGYTYMRVTNPSLVYYRMLQDAARLRDWANRMGDDTHKGFARELERILILKQSLFTADFSAAEADAPKSSVTAQQWDSAEKSVLAKNGITEPPQPSYEDRLRWHRQNPAVHPHPDDN